MTKCGMKCEIFSRVVGYMRPVGQWNKGKQEEFRERLEFQEGDMLASAFALRGYPTPAMEKAAEYRF